MYPNMGNLIVVPIMKKMDIIQSIQVCLISQMKFDYKENGGKRNFLINPKHQDRVSQCREHDSSANKKKNRDYYEHIGFPYFINELRL